MTEASPYLERMLLIAREGGGIALELLNKSEPGLKKDHSIITLADKAISKLARERLGDFLKDPGHLLIDEEDPSIVEARTVWIRRLLSGRWTLLTERAFMPTACRYLAFP